METSKKQYKGTIKLPVQTLNMKLIKQDELKKIIFQFDVKHSDNGSKVFSLVAYPAYRGKKWRFGKRIEMPVKSGVKLIRLKLPLTLGNLDLKSESLKDLTILKDAMLTFTPYLYKENNHAAYTVSDGVSIVDLYANPCPPGKPAEEQ